MAPAKMMSVARPSTLGPMDDSDTLTSAATTMATTLGISGPRRRSSRLADGPKSIDFWPTIPMPCGPRPAPIGPWIRSVSFILLGAVMPRPP